jgi:hypothetical protein
LTTVAISVFIVKFKSSNPAKIYKHYWYENVLTWIHAKTGHLNAKRLCLLKPQSLRFQLMVHQCVKSVVLYCVFCEGVTYAFREGVIYVKKTIFQLCLTKTQYFFFMKCLCLLWSRLLQCYCYLKLSYANSLGSHWHIMTQPKFLQWQSLMPIAKKRND